MYPGIWGYDKLGNGRYMWIDFSSGFLIDFSGQTSLLPLLLDHLAVLVLIAVRHVGLILFGTGEGEREGKNRCRKKKKECRGIL